MAICVEIPNFAAFQAKDQNKNQHTLHIWWSTPSTPTGAEVQLLPPRTGPIRPWSVASNAVPRANLDTRATSGFPCQDSHDQHLNHIFDPECNMAIPTQQTWPPSRIENPGFQGSTACLELESGTFCTCDVKLFKATVFLKCVNFPSCNCLHNPRSCRTK